MKRIKALIAAAHFANELGTRHVTYINQLLQIRRLVQSALAVCKIDTTLAWKV